jgi:hypothetical protein
MVDSLIKISFYLSENPNTPKIIPPSKKMIGTVRLPLSNSNTIKNIKIEVPKKHPEKNMVILPCIFSPHKIMVLSKWRQIKTRHKCPSQLTNGTSI